MKNQKGVTLISLVITIILLIVLSGVGIHTGLETYENMRVQGFITKMMAIQEAVDKLCEKHSIDDIISGMGETYGGETVPDEAKKILDEIISDADNLNSWTVAVDSNPNNYKYFNINNISSILGIKDFDTAIWVNPKSRNVIAIDGVKYNDKTYYRQYDLPGGQTLPEPNINVNFTLDISVKTYDNKAEIVLLKDSNETIFSQVKYYKQKEGTEDYSDAKILNNVSKISLDETGVYRVEATDSLGNTQSQEGIIVTVVNKPLLVDGMTPIKFEGSTMIDTTADDKDWYNYGEDTRNWANAKLADGSVYVWIPRFAYEIDDTEKTVNIRFLRDFSQMGSNGKAIPSTYKVAPVFQDGTKRDFANGEWDSEITGFWLAKYETTEDSGKPKSVSVNSQSWREITPTSAFDLCRQMESDYKEIYFGEAVSAASGTFANGVYQVDNNNIDTHLMKNSEWGAVAYLTHSKYGIENKTNKVVNKILSYYIEENIGIEYSSNNNYTGVYGLNGGANDIVAAGTDILGYFNSENKSTKYATVYTTGTITDDSNKIYGDAMKETSSWNDNTTSTITQLIARGGDYNETSGTGIFSYYNKNYDAETTATFRPVLIVEY